MFGLTAKKESRLKSVWAGAVHDHAIALGWSADGHFLAASASTGPTAIFDAHAGTGDRILTGHAGGTLALAWSPTAPILATAGKDGRVNMWDSAGRQMIALESDGRWIEHLAWHSNGTKLAASSGRTVHLWNSDGIRLAQWPDHPSTVSDLAWRPGTDSLAVLCYGGAMLWTLREGAAPTFKLYAWKGSPLRMAWSPNGAMLAHGNQDSTVHFWYAETAEDLQMSGYPRKIRELSWDSTSRYLATGGGRAVCLWDCGSSGPAGSTPQMLEGHGAGKPLTALQFQHRGALLASGGADGRVCVWQPKNKKQPLLGSFDGDGGEATAVAWSPNDKLLAVGFESGAVNVLAVS